MKVEISVKHCAELLEIDRKLIYDWIEKDEFPVDENPHKPYMVYPVTLTAKRAESLKRLVPADAFLIWIESGKIPHHEEQIKHHQNQIQVARRAASTLRQYLGNGNDSFKKMKDF